MNFKLTTLLERVRHDDSSAVEELVDAVYHELHQMAQRLVRREGAESTLATTEVVHEAYLRLFRRGATWQDRRHFFGSAARAMRRVLVDRARFHMAGKRIPKSALISIEVANLPPEMPDLDLIAVDQALDRLAERHPRQARIVALRFFAGLSDVEIAKLLDVSRMTVHREWKVARLLLLRDLRA